MNTVLEKTYQILHEGGLIDAYHQVVADLGAALQITAADDEFRAEVGALKAAWTCLSQILVQKIGGSLVPEETVLRLRIIRGAVLVARNLLVENQRYAEELGIPAMIFPFLSSSEPVPEVLESLYTNLQVSAWEFLANYSAAPGVSLLGWLEPIATATIVPAVALPAFTALCNMFSSSEIVSLALKEHPDLVTFLHQEMALLDTDKDLPSWGLVLVTILTKVVSHESYGSYLKGLDRAEYFKGLQLAQLVITSQQPDHWDNYEVTAMLSWIWPLGELLAAAAGSILPQALFEPAALAEIHRELVIILDLLSDLAKYEEARQFLRHYKAVESLVALLGVVAQNVDRVTLKDREKAASVTGKVFPHVKSLIVEILAFLVFECFEVQEQIRELHGLEVALTCCNIDDNEPYIKERAIILLRYLLANNPQNQEFVAQLEAREALPDDLLEQAGFEVEITEGKVKLKPNSAASGPLATDLGKVALEPVEGLQPTDQMDITE